MSSSSCINCGSFFLKRSGGYQRYSVEKVIHKSKEIREVLTELLDLSHQPVTPLAKSDVPAKDRSLCFTCYSDLEKIERRKQDIVKKHEEIANIKREFLDRLKESTYLHSKRQKRPRQVLTPSTTPLAKKKHKPESTAPAGITAHPGQIGAARNKKKTVTFASQASKHLHSSSYQTLFRLLLNKSDRARRHFLAVLQECVRREVNNFCKQSSYTSQLLTHDVLLDFSWKKFLKETRFHLPILHTMLEACVTNRGNLDKVEIDEDGKLGPLVPGLGLVLSILLRLKKPNRFRLIQSIISAQLYRHGCSQKLQTWFHKAGLCLSVGGAKNIIDRLILQFDVDARKLKNSIEGLYQIRGDATEDNDLSWLSDMASGVVGITLSDDEETSGEASSEECDDPGQQLFAMEVDRSTPSQSKRRLFDDETPISGLTLEKKLYSLTWDNVQYLAIRRHHTTEQKNTFHLWALAFMTENRIGTVSVQHEEDVVEASSIPLNCFLPSKDDWNLLKARMVVLVQRLLVDYFPQMKDRFHSCVTEHVPNVHSAESSKQSHVVNLGVYHEDPSSTKGVVRIMKSLQQYVPMTTKGHPHTILVNGDQLSVERMVSARMCMASSAAIQDRLIGMEPSPQEFHKRCILLQDTMNELYLTKSVAEKGTLYQIRTKFGHVGVKKHVMKCVNHTVDFFQFTTSGMLCLLVMEIGGMSSLEDVPLDCPEKEDPLEDRKKYFDQLAEKVVEYCWPKIYETTIDAVIRVPEESTGDDDEKVCSCDGKNVSDAFTIQCSAREKCSGARFYHPSCVGMEDELPEDDWWCSENCQHYSVFCFCKKNVPETWIGCESGELCLGAKQGWFHLACVGLKRLPRLEWYCSDECRAFHAEHKSILHERTRSGSVDHVQEYTCAVLWEGLWHMAHRDTERENDGPEILSQWKLDMLRFWSNNHYKYLILGHRLLAGVNGWLPDSLKEDLTWNRVANLTGGKGKNIALDLVNEFLNNEFKQNIKRARGQYTDKQINRMGKLIGMVGKGLDNICERELMDRYTAKPRRTKAKYKTDVQKFVESYKVCRLFDHIPGRSHASFPEFQHSIIVKAPGKLKGRLLKYSRKLDVEKNVLHMP